MARTPAYVRKAESALSDELEAVVRALTPTPIKRRQLFPPSPERADGATPPGTLPGLADDWKVRGRWQPDRRREEPESEPEKPVRRKPAAKKPEPKKPAPARKPARAKAIPKPSEEKPTTLPVTASPPRQYGGRRLVGHETMIETRTGAKPAVYEVWPLRDIIPSHNPRTWGPSPLYPEGCQQRDYTHDKSEQAKVLELARNFDPKFLLTDEPTAINGPPVIARNGIALGGNGRTMGLQLLEEAGRFEEYADRLLDRAELFGINRSDLLQSTSTDNVLVRVVEADMSSCAQWSNVLNQSLTQEVDITSETISYARQLSPQHLDDLGELFANEEADTISAAIGNPAVERRVVQIFRAADIISSRNQSQWLDPAFNRLSQLGQLMVERVLLGAILKDKRLIDAARDYTARIIKTAPLLIRMRALPDEWDLSKAIETAIRHESRRRSTGQTKTDARDQTSAFDAPLDDREKMVYHALDAGPIRWKNWLESYVVQAERETDLERGNLFETSPLSPEDVMRRLSADGLGDEVVSTGGLTKLSDVSKQSFRPVALVGRWRKFFGNPPPNFWVLFWGRPGSMKSTAALDYVSDLSRVRGDDGQLWSILYATTEEAVKNGAFRNRAKTVGAQSDRVYLFEARTLDEIDKELERGNYNAVVIDSVSLLPKKSDILAFEKKWQDRITGVMIAHATSDSKKAKGPVENEHQVDAIVWVDKGVMSTFSPGKNRFGTSAGETMKVLKK